MSAISLESLGFTREELLQKVVDQVAENVLAKRVRVQTEDGEEDDYEVTALARRLEEVVQERIDVAVATVVDRHILPNATRYVEEISLQATNQWGEKKGKALSFREYLVARAETYLTEQVDYDGKSKEESGGYSWSGRQTRLVHMTHKHLHYEIEKAMKEALQVANSHIVKGIHESIRLALNGLLANLKVKVETR